MIGGCFLEFLSSHHVLGTDAVNSHGSKYKKEGHVRTGSTEIVFPQHPA